jgi:hypothetical protein
MNYFSRAFVLFQNPSKAIPLGTNVAIVLTTFVYLAFCIIAGCTTHREVFCMCDICDKIKHIFPILSVDFYERRNGSIMQVMNCSLRLDDKRCKSGLVYNYQTMKMIYLFELS